MKAMRWLFIIIVVAVFLVGFAAGYSYYVYKSMMIPDKWFEVSKIPLKGKESGFSYTPLLESNIPLPEIKAASAKLKFMKAFGRRAALGYVITAEVSSLDPSKFPGKAAVYEIETQFKLIDKDGFTLLVAKGSKHELYPGQTNVWQDIASEIIPLEFAQRTNLVAPKITVTRCLTCQ